MATITIPVTDRYDILVCKGAVGASPNLQMVVNNMIIQVSSNLDELGTSDLLKRGLEQFRLNAYGFSKKSPYFFWNNPEGIREATMREHRVQELMALLYEHDTHFPV